MVEYSARIRYLESEAVLASEAVTKAFQLTGKLEQELRTKDLHIDSITKRLLHAEREKEATLQQRLKVSSELAQLKSKAQPPTHEQECNTTARFEDHNYKDCLEQREEMKCIILQLEGENSQYQDTIDELELEITRLKSRNQPTKRSLPANSDSDSPQSIRNTPLDPEAMTYPRNASEYNKMVAEMLLEKRTLTKEFA